MKNMSSSNLKTAYNEINIMKKLNHPNIIRLLEASQDGQYCKTNG
jgi:serine/threonine protein kinase